MSDFQGMDTEAADAVAGNIEAFANEIDSIFDGAFSAVQSADWLGPDADEYKGNFETQMRAALDGFRETVNALAQELRGDIEEQNSASGS